MGITHYDGSGSVWMTRPDGCTSVTRSRSVGPDAQYSRVRYGGPAGRVCSVGRSSQLIRHHYAPVTRVEGGTGTLCSLAR